jgi:hypothetical protein
MLTISPMLLLGPRPTRARPASAGRASMVAGALKERGRRFQPDRRRKKPAPAICRGRFLYPCPIRPRELPAQARWQLQPAAAGFRQPAGVGETLLGFDGQCILLERSEIFRCLCGDPFPHRAENARLRYMPEIALRRRLPPLRHVETQCQSQPVGMGKTVGSRPA